MVEQQVASVSSIASTWQSQEKWSKAASRFKACYERSKLAALVLSCAGAIMAVASDQTCAKSVRGEVTSVSALFLLLVPVVTRMGASQNALERWLRARSVSEQLKTETYQYLTRTGPYGDTAATTVLIKRRDSLLEKVADLEPSIAGIATGRLLPAVNDVSTYITLRVDDQIENYYEPKATEHYLRARIYRWIEGVMAVLGAVVAATSSIKDNPIAATWVAVLTTVGTAVAAHLLAGRHEQLVPDYLATARHLRSLKESFLAAHPIANQAPAAAINGFITAAEGAISVQSEGWMAEWLKNPRPPALT